MRVIRAYTMMFQRVQVLDIRNFGVLLSHWFRRLERLEPLSIEPEPDVGVEEGTGAFAPNACFFRWRHSEFWAPASMQVLWRRMDE